MDHARRLVGVGLGPGDPELLTCKAVRALREADVIVVPVAHPAGDEPGRAELTVLAHLDDAPIRRAAVSTAEVGGPVTDGSREGVDRAAAMTLEAYAEGAGTVVVAMLGDPSVYSAFGQVTREVLDARPDVRVEVVPGITAMQALAAASRTPLVEGTESLTLVPATAGLASFTDALEHSDTVVAYKGGRYLGSVRGELTRRGRLEGAVLGTEVGLEGERIAPLSELPAGSRADDLSTVIVPAARVGRGDES